MIRVKSRLVGYARVSTKDQDLNLQIDTPKQAGCDRGSILVMLYRALNLPHPALDKCLDNLKESDTLIVWRLDRLGRSMAHLVGLVQ